MRLPEEFQNWALDPSRTNDELFTVELLLEWGRVVWGWKHQQPKIHDWDREQAHRKDADERHREQCVARLNVLLEQKDDMRQAFDELVDDIAHGVRRFKVYRQMKMYNDASLNPVLYGKGSPR